MADNNSSVIFVFTA